MHHYSNNWDIKKKGAINWEPDYDEWREAQELKRKREEYKKQKRMKRYYAKGY